VELGPLTTEEHKLKSLAEQRCVEEMWKGKIQRSE
jgi:hypothetical protein